MSLTVKIRGDATQFEKTMRGVNSTVSGLGTKIAGLGAAALAAAGSYATLGTAFEQLKTASSKAADLESLTIQMATLTGSTKTAKDMIALFVKEEQKSALNTQDYADAAKTMLAFGVSQKGLIPYMRALADVSLGNSERFKSLAIAFAQTTAAGRLMGQEVLQFVNAGFNPLQQISLRTGESMAQLKKRMEAGGVSVREVKQAFIEATSIGGKFYKAIENGASSMEAKIAQTKGAITQLQVAFGTGMNEGLKVALDATTNFLPQLNEKFTTAGEYVGKAIADAVNKDYDKLALIGEFIGTTLGVAMKHAFKKAIMGSIEQAIVDFEFEANNRIAQGASRESERIKSDAKFQRVFGSKGTELISRGIKSFGEYRANFGAEFKSNYEAGKAYSEQGNQDLANKLEAALAPILQRINQSKFSN